VSIAGRARALIVLLALAACGIGALALLLREGPRPVTATSGAPAPPQVRASVPEPAEIGRRSSAAAEGAVPPREPPAPVADAGSAGRGIIRGELLTREAGGTPERWTLVVEPHPWLEGHQHAVTRRLEFEHGETQFEVGDLPLGGYLVRAQAASKNCLPASVLLVPGSSNQFVTLALLPSGFIDGGVLDADGRPAEGLDVTLESVETKERSTLSTDAAGTFLFRDVLDGEYQISFGRPDSPLLPPQSIAFRAPSLRFPTRTLPPTGSVKITVLEPTLRPAARVRVSGTAIGGGAVDVFSDHMGIARARYLAPGHYRLDARTDDGLEASSAIDVEAGKEAPLEMIVRPRRS
jgi:hypothetical protein